MPLYTFICKKCGWEFDALIELKDKNKKVKCAKCGSAANRIISTPARPVIN